jgi:hypothetical protein
MAEETDYEKLLADLEEERAGIDLMIAFVKRRLGQSAEAASSTPPITAAGTVTQRFPRLAQDTFFRMSVPQAIKTFLNIAKRPKTAKEITAALDSGGLTHQAKNLYATVYPTLMRMETGGEVVRVSKGEWGLAEWYPSGRKANQEEKTESED